MTVNFYAHDCDDMDESVYIKFTAFRNFQFSRQVGYGFQLVPKIRIL